MNGLIEIVLLFFGVVIVFKVLKGLIKFVVTGVLLALILSIVFGGVDIIQTIKGFIWCVSMIIHSWGDGMNHKVKDLINDLTESIIEKYQIQMPIKDLDKVVRRLGGCVVVCDTNIPRGLRREGDGFVVYVSPSQDEERRRFAIAQELGHLFLHMGYLISKDLWNKQDSRFYRPRDPLMEHMANEFATALLMPRKEYIRIMELNTVGETVETKDIAKYFGVSVSIASNRGRDLGYLQ